ncbi:unnamed protein product [Arctogadus glacialis]
MQRWHTDEAPGRRASHSAAADSTAKCSHSPFLPPPPSPKRLSQDARTRPAPAPPTPSNTPGVVPPVSYRESIGTSVVERAPCRPQDRRVAHYLPKRTQDSPVQKVPPSPVKSSPETTPTTSPPRQRRDSDRFCQLCNAWFNNPGMAQQHYDGKKHKKNAARADLLEQLGKTLDMGEMKGKDQDPPGPPRTPQD